MKTIEQLVEELNKISDELYICLKNDTPAIPGVFLLRDAINYLEILESNFLLAPKQKILKASIDNLPLEESIRKQLKESGIKTIKALVGFDTYNLHKIIGVDDLSIKKIKKALWFFKLSLGENLAKYELRPYRGQKRFYATLCIGDGGGYVTIHAKDKEEARNKMFSSSYGEKWAFMYSEEEKYNCIDIYNLKEKEVIL